MIKLIDINKIEPHPDNPRKDLGDLEELVESIKANGILQNLTVVPWFSEITKTGCDDPEQQKEMGYRVVIGHRRLAAAKLAGLKEVPCVISDMDYKTQIATMLLENMQRSDLTVYEQVQGFQMMLELGETISSISEKTGFSESTIRRRTKLLELDQEKLKETMSRGVTLEDYARLEKIKDIELRNEVLETIGTSDFEWTLRRAIEEEQREKKFNEILTEIKKFATETEDTNGLVYKDAYYGRPSDKLEIPDNIDKVKYFYRIQHGYIYLYYEDPEGKESSQEDKEKEELEKLRKERHSKLEELTRISYELRREFIKKYSNTKAKEHIRTIIQYAIFMIGEKYQKFFYWDIADILNIKLNEEKDAEWDDISDEISRKPELSLLTAIYSIMDREHYSYYNWDCEYSPNKSLDRVYDFLEELGYEMSEEEAALRNGTHELFIKAE